MSVELLKILYFNGDFFTQKWQNSNFFIILCNFLLVKHSDFWKNETLTQNNRNFSN